MKKDIRLLSGKHWAGRSESAPVEVMAVVGIHAMVRRIGCLPFVCDSRHLSEKVAQTDERDSNSPSASSTLPKSFSTVPPTKEI